VLWTVIYGGQYKAAAVEFAAAGIHVNPVCRWVIDTPLVKIYQLYPADLEVFKSVELLGLVAAVHGCFRRAARIIDWVAFSAFRCKNK
jgi:NAD(P)-dependent dehydrogenase (short-subunit alcohol dehydrogenase family)